jgi:hypothetical protein
LVVYRCFGGGRAAGVARIVRGARPGVAAPGTLARHGVYNAAQMDGQIVEIER